MKVEKSYKELQAFDNVATAYLIKHGFFKINPETKQGDFTNKEITKLVANMKKIIKQGQELFAEYSEKVADLKIDYCSVDEKTKAILYDDVPNSKGGVDRNYRFTKERLKEFNKKVKELADEKVELHARITDGEWELTDDEKDAFSGLLIPEIKKEDASE